MKLELRHETDVACEACGVTSLMETARGETLTMELAPILEREWNKREVELTGVFASTLNKLEAEYQQAINERAEFLSAALGASPSWYRPLKRRWYRRLDEQLSDALEDLRARTRL